MTVWCVLYYNHNGGVLEKIFTTKLAAEAHLFNNKLYEYYEIEEWVVDE